MNGMNHPSAKPWLIVAALGLSLLLAAATQFPWHHQEQRTEDYQSRYLTTLCDAALDFNVAAIAFLQAPHPTTAPTAPAIDVRDFTAGMRAFRDDYIRRYNTAARRAGHARMAKLGLPDRVQPDNLDQCLGTPAHRS